MQGSKRARSDAKSAQRNVSMGQPVRQRDAQTAQAAASPSERVALGPAGPDSGVRWDDVRLFLAVYRGKQLSAAARKLQVDASTVSRRLVQLEESLGTALFDRTRDGLLATRAAEELLPVAEECETGVLRFMQAVSELEAAVEGTVRITAPPVFVELFIAPILPKLLERYPGLRVELDTNQQLLDLTRREADIALRTIKPTRGDLVVTRFTTERYLGMTSKAYAKSLGTLARFSDARWIDWGQDLSYLPMSVWVNQYAGAEPVVRTSSLAAQIAAARSGCGVALVPERIGQASGLCQVAYAPELAGAAASWPVETLWLVGHRALRHVPRVSAVWEFLLAQANGV